jgi:hypothetical protein
MLATKNIFSSVKSGSKILFTGSLSTVGIGIDLIVVITEKYAPQANEAKKNKQVAQ